MKYTKKVPYFKKGDKVKKRVEVGNTGKTKEEIMAEARKNQTREKGQQAMDKEAELAKENRKKASTPSVGAGFKRPTAKVIAPVDTRSGQIENTVGRPVPKTKDQAFQQARKRGDSEFLWKGKRYHTRTAEEEATGTSLPSNTTTNAAAAEQTTSAESTNDGWKSPDWGGVEKIWESMKYQQGETGKDKTSAGVEQSTSSTVNSGSTTSSENPETAQQNRTNTYVENNEYTGPKYYRREFVTNSEGMQVPVYFSGRDPENLKRIRDYALVNRGPHYRVQKIFDKIDSGELKKQGGTINKFQRGTQGSGITRADLPKTSKWNIFGFRPDAAKWFPTDRNLRLGQTEEVSRYMHRNKDITTLRRPRPYYTADQPSMYNSTRTINWDNNTPLDTTYTYRGRVIQPNTIDHERYKAAFAGGDRALLQNIGKHQQGGQVEQQPQMTEEDLIMDFTVRYLSALGVAPEEIMDQEGNLNPTYVEEITNIFQRGDIDWESYMASPDEYIQQFVGSRMQMARKGAKLKRLSQLRIYKK